MKRFLNIIHFCLFISICASVAKAQTYVSNVGKTPINFILPDGYCLLDTSNPSDAYLLNTTKGAVANQKSSHLFLCGLPATS